MGFDWKKHGLAACLATGLVAVGTSTVMAQDEADPFAAPGSRVSGSVSFDYWTHFVSYGYDVWDGGNDFGDNSTFNPSASVNIALTDNANLFMGSWADVNDNAPPSIGGQLQEVDAWIGADYTIDKFTLSLTYQWWNYGATVENILDFGISFDDSEYLGDWAMSPSLTIHRTSDPQNGTDEGWAYVLGFGPGFTFNADGDYPIDLSIPMTVAFGDDDFYYDSGFAFFSIGAQVSIPLAFIDESYGSWSLNAGLTYYMTDDDAIPQNALYAGDNPDEDYLVGNIGVALAF